jgi:hypothetical protein
LAEKVEKQEEKDNDDDGGGDGGEDGQYEDEVEFPRSHSLPNMIWRSAPIEEPELDGEWQYAFQRDFPMEIQTYFNSLKDKPKKLPENMHARGPLANEDIKLKICDLGNGCWTHHHFTTKI